MRISFTGNESTGIPFAIDISRLIIFQGTRQRIIINKEKKKKNEITYDRCSFFNRAHEQSGNTVLSPIVFFFSPFFAPP